MEITEICISVTRMREQMYNYSLQHNIKLVHRNVNTCIRFPHFHVLVLTYYSPVSVTVCKVLFNLPYKSTFIVFLSYSHKKKILLQIKVLADFNLAVNPRVTHAQLLHALFGRFQYQSPNHQIYCYIVHDIQYMKM